MATTLEWVRDKYDRDHDRRINSEENGYARMDNFRGLITTEQMLAVNNAYMNKVLLPEYGTYHTLSVTDQLISVIIPTGATLKIDGVEVI